MINKRLIQISYKPNGHHIVPRGLHMLFPIGSTTFQYISHKTIRTEEIVSNQTINIGIPKEIVVQDIWVLNGLLMTYQNFILILEKMLFIVMEKNLLKEDLLEHY